MVLEDLLAGGHADFRCGVFLALAAERTCLLELDRRGLVGGDGARLHPNGAVVGFIEVPAGCRSCVSSLGGVLGEFGSTDFDVLGCRACMDFELVGAGCGLAGVFALAFTDGHLDAAVAGTGSVHGEELAGGLAVLEFAGDLVILVEREGVLALGIDIQGDHGVFRDQGRVAGHDALRDHRSGTNEHRQLIQGCVVAVEDLATLVELAGPVVHPLLAGREEDAVADVGLGKDGCYQEVGAQHELVVRFGTVGPLLVREFEGHGAHHGDAGGGGFLRERVDEGHELLAELQVLAVDGCCLVAVEPRTLVRRGPAGHGVQRRSEGFPLKVADVGLGGPAKDAVNVAGGECQARVAGAGEGRDLPADGVEVS
ncbi:hypothetical protein PJL18_04217 [Paenarthrobacter nicotinovorans]|nr:hypothetical protein [Paenarthrobacter nicotinovorans]